MTLQKIQKRFARDKINLARNGRLGGQFIFRARDNRAEPELFARSGPF